MARTDYLTGAINSRFFYDLVQMEIIRFQRYQHAFTIVYFDIDDFKSVNDRFGHAVGDQVLASVAHLAGKHLRKADVFARLGGDEFALLLPETDQQSAQVVLSKIQGDIADGMQPINLSMSLSIGMLTCVEAPNSPEKLVSMVDDLMYSVKRSGKNAVKHSIYTG